MSVEMKFLKKGQKEILIRCGKDYRFVVDYDDANLDTNRIMRRVKSFQVAG